MEEERATLTVNFEWTKTTGWIFNTEDGSAFTLHGVKEDSEDLMTDYFEIKDVIAEFFDETCVRMDEVIDNPFEMERS